MTVFQLRKFICDPPGRSAGLFVWLRFHPLGDRQRFHRWPVDQLNVGAVIAGGMVSKHRDSAYRAGRFDRWVKVKNRRHPAFSRVMEQFG